MRTTSAVALSLALASTVSAQTGSARIDRQREAGVRAALEAEHRAAGLESARLQETEAVLHALEAMRAGTQLPLPHVVGPPEAWAPQDPADSLWRRARERLNAGDPEAAARLFRQIRTEARFAQSAYRADAFYWEAFSLIRIGNPESLREAKAVLEALEDVYPPERRSPDAAALAARIEAQLAARGSEEAAQELYGKLAAAARPPIRTTEAAALAQAAELRALTEAKEAAGVTSRNRAETLLRAEEQREAALQAARERRETGLVSAESRTAAGLLRARELESALQRRTGLLALRSSPQCQTEEEEIRLIALNALLEMDDSAALPALREVMARRDECAPQLRRHAMMILARRSSPGTEALALDAARDDTDPEVRQMALMWLIEKDNAAALDIAQSLLRADEDRQTRQAAIMALARSRNERARQILREFVRSEAPVELRGEALMALPLTRDRADAQFLRQLYGETQDRQLKEYALMALGRRALDGDGDWLLAIARRDGEDVELRTQALWMLRSDTSVATTAIAAIYDRGGDRRLREAALMIIAERSHTEAAALDKIIAIARADPDAEFRKQAVMTLSRSKEPRAHAVLLEILRNR